MIANFIKFQQYGDERGALVALEDMKNVPFPIRRIYYMFGCAEGVLRGEHAHKQLKQVLIAVRGSCRFLLDDGHSRTEVVLDDPAQGLLVDPMVWHEMWDFSEDCLLMALADAHYDEADYIRNYQEFLRNAAQ